MAKIDEPNRVRPPQRGNDEWRMGQEKNYNFTVMLKTHTLNAKAT